MRYVAAHAGPAAFEAALDAVLRALAERGADVSGGSRARAAFGERSRLTGPRAAVG
ncbi:MAG TPA: hypothetical protein VIY27_05330 [Myxococcota bacterium]